MSFNILFHFSGSKNFCTIISRERLRNFSKWKTEIFLSMLGLDIFMCRSHCCRLYIEAACWVRHLLLIYDRSLRPLLYNKRPKLPQIAQPRTNALQSIGLISGTFPLRIDLGRFLFLLDSNSFFCSGKGILVFSMEAFFYSTVYISLSPPPQYFSFFTSVSIQL